MKIIKKGKRIIFRKDKEFIFKCAICRCEYSYTGKELNKKCRVDCEINEIDSPNVIVRDKEKCPYCENENQILISLNSDYFEVINQK